MDDRLLQWTLIPLCRTLMMKSRRPQTTKSRKKKSQREHCHYRIGVEYPNDDTHRSARLNEELFTRSLLFR